MTYIFDFDGTLVDSMPIWGKMYTELLEEYGLSYPSDFVKTITPLGNSGAADMCIALGLKKTKEEIAEITHKRFLEAYSRVIKLKENVKETLLGLKREGNSLNVLTASPHKYLDVCLIHNEVFELFDNIWSIDDFGYAKNEKIIYKEVADFVESLVEAESKGRCTLCLLVRG